MDRQNMQSESNRSVIAKPVFLGNAPAIERVRVAADRVARGDAKVLITGESGVGKDVLGRYLHAQSPRARSPFVALNCAGVSETLLESELFGHVKGSFTGAHRDKVGKLQLAASRHDVPRRNRRDEPADAGAAAAIPRERRNPAGRCRHAGRAGRRARDLRHQSQSAGNGCRGAIPRRPDVPHQGRASARAAFARAGEDIRLLVQHAIERRTGSQVIIDEEAMQVLERYRWPGNVRELQNVVEQLAWLGHDGRVGVPDLPPALLAAAPSAIMRKHERRRQVADDLFQTLTSGSHKFWDHVYTLFLNRDITRHDMRELVRRGLTATSGNYRAMLHLFGIDSRDYKRFLNFLAAHDCNVDFRQFRTGVTATPIERPAVVGAPASPIHRPPLQGGNVH